MLVADTFNDRVQKFNANGSYVTQFGEAGSGGGQFKGPVGVAVGDDGSIFVTDTGNDRVEKFAPDGTFLFDLGWFDAPTGIATDDFGNVYVSDSYYHSIEGFRAEDGRWQSSWGYQGSRLGEFDAPTGIATDPSGAVFVSDTYNKRIQALQPCCGLLLYGPWQVKKGAHIKLRGELLGTLPECVEGSEIRLLKKNNQVGTTLTNTKGAFHFEQKVTKTIKFTAVFDGKPFSAGLCNPAESYPWRIYVNRAPARSGATRSGVGLVPHFRGRSLRF